MEDRRKRQALTLGGLFLGLVLSGGFLGLAFSPQIRAGQKEMAAQKKLLFDYKALLSHKQDYESEWKSKEALFLKSGSPEESLNLWVKSILDYAQSQKIVFEKIEPAGIQEKDGQKALRLLVRFRGDIGQLVRILHHFYGADPLTQIKSLVIKAGEGEKAMDYEIGLGRILK